MAQTYIFQSVTLAVLGLSLTACSSHIQTDRYGADTYKQQTSSHYNYSAQVEVRASRYGGPMTPQPCDITLQPCGYVVQYVAVPPPPVGPQPLRLPIECCDPPSIPEPPTAPRPPVLEPPIVEPPVSPPTPQPPIYEPPIAYPPIDNPEPPIWMPPRK